MADAVLGRSEDHRRRTPAIRIAAIMPGAADHVLPQPPIIRGFGQICANFPGTFLDGGDAAGIKVHGGAVDQMLPSQRATSLAFHLGDAGEFLLARLLHGLKVVIMRVAYVEGEGDCVRHCVDRARLRRYYARCGEAVVGLCDGVRSHDHFAGR